MHRLTWLFSPFAGARVPICEKTESRQRSRQPGPVIHGILREITALHLIKNHHSEKRAKVKVKNPFTDEEIRGQRIYFTVMAEINILYF